MAAVRVIMHWLLLPYIVTAVTGNIVVRPNVGVLFVPTPAPQTAILHWHHTFALSLNLSVSSNSSTEGFKDTISCPNGTSICPNLLALANLQHETTARITDQLLLTKDQIIHLMSLPATKRVAALAPGAGLARRPIAAWACRASGFPAAANRHRAQHRSSTATDRENMRRSNRNGRLRYGAGLSNARRNRVQSRCLRQVCGYKCLCCSAR